MKITLNKFKSKNSIANFNVAFDNGLTLSFCELIITKDGKEFITHNTQSRQEDKTYKTKYHSYMTEDFQKSIIDEVKKQHSALFEKTEKPMVSTTW